MHDQFMDIGDMRLRYRVEGEGDWVVLLHGVGASLEQWDGFVEALGGKYRILRFDQRGHGETSKPAGPYAMSDFVEDLDGLLNRLNVGRFHLIGRSFGGMIAQAYALTHQDRLRSLVILSAAAGRNEEEKAKVLDRLEKMNDQAPSGHFERSADRWFTAEFLAANPDIVQQFAESIARNDPQGYAAAYRVLATTDLIDRLHEIRVPTLIGTGEFDEASNPRMARAMHEKIAGSELVIFPKLKHLLLVEAPDQVVGVVEPFLRRAEALSA